MIKIIIENHEGDHVTVNTFDKGFHNELLQIKEIIENALKEQEYRISQVKMAD